MLRKIISNLNCYIFDINFELKYIFVSWKLLIFFFCESNNSHLVRHFFSTCSFFVNTCMMICDFRFLNAMIWCRFIMIFERDLNLKMFKNAMILKNDDTNVENLKKYDECSKIKIFVNIDDEWIKKQFDLFDNKNENCCIDWWLF